MDPQFPFLQGISFGFKNVQQRTRRVRAKPHPPEVWEPHKERIRHLYIVEGLPLEQIIPIMRSEANFVATRSQYIGQINIKWQFRKTLSSHDFDYIEFRKRKRGEKPTRVKFNGVLVPEETLSRKRQRKNITTFEAKLKEIELRNTERNPPNSPPDLEVGTPSPNPSIQIDESNHQQPDVTSITNSMNSMSISSGSNESYLDNYDDEMASDGSGATEKAVSLYSHQSGSLTSLSASEVTTASQRDALFKLFWELQFYYKDLPSFTLDRIITKMKAKIIQVPPCIPATPPGTWTTSKIREMSMPPTIRSSENAHDRSLGKKSTIFVAESILNKLHTFVMRLSNKIDSSLVQWDLVDDLLKSKLLESNIYTLKVFLNYQNPMIKDFAVQVFYSAARLGNLEILKLVLHTVFDKVPEQCTCNIRATGIQFAILHQQNDIVDYLMTRTQHLNETPLMFPDYNLTLLHSAVFVGDVMILERLLDAGVTDHLALLSPTGSSYQYLHELAKKSFGWAQKLVTFLEGKNLTVPLSASLYALVLGNDELTFRLSPFDGKKGCDIPLKDWSVFTQSVMPYYKLSHFKIMLDCLGLTEEHAFWRSPFTELSLLEAALLWADTEIIRYILQSGVDLNIVHPSVLLSAGTKRSAILDEIDELQEAWLRVKSQYEEKPIPSFYVTKSFEFRYDLQAANMNMSWVISELGGVLSQFKLSENTSWELYFNEVKNSLFVGKNLIKNLQLTVWSHERENFSSFATGAIFFSCYGPKDVSHLRSILNTTKYLRERIKTLNCSCPDHQSNSIYVYFPSLEVDTHSRISYFSRFSGLGAVENNLPDGLGYKNVEAIANDSYWDFCKRNRNSWYGLNNFAHVLDSRWRKKWKERDWLQKLDQLEAAFIYCSDKDMFSGLQAILEEFAERALHSGAREQFRRIFRLALRYNQHPILENILPQLDTLDLQVLLDVLWYSDIKSFFIVQQKHDLKNRISTPYFALIAIYKGQLLKLAKLMEEEAVDVNHQFDGNMTLLKYAARLGRMDMAKFLIIRGANSDPLPLIAKEAVKFGHMALAEMIMETPTEEDRLSLSMASLSMRSASLSPSTHSSETKANKWLLGRFLESGDSNLRPSLSNSNWRAIKGFMQGYGFDRRSRRQGKSVEELLKPVQDSEEKMSLSSSSRQSSVNNFYDEMDLMADPEFSFVL